MSPDLQKINAAMNKLPNYYTEKVFFGEKCKKPTPEKEKKPFLQFIFKKVVKDKTGKEGFTLSGYHGKLYEKQELPFEYTEQGTPHFYLQGGNLWISGLEPADLPGVRFDTYHKMHEIPISSFSTDLHIIHKEEFTKFLSILKSAGERLTRINREIRNKKKTWKGSVTVTI